MVSTSALLTLNVPNQTQKSPPQKRRSTGPHSQTATQRMVFRISSSNISKGRSLSSQSSMTFPKSSPIWTKTHEGKSLKTCNTATNSELVPRSCGTPWF